jgi:sugar/nucleoside kinase (ribokinase family)
VGDAMPPKLICYGDLCVDIILQADSFPQAGQDSIVRQAAFMPAGSAANCAVTAARLRVSTQFVGVIGRDALGDVLFDDLKSNGVGVEYLRRAQTPTAVTIAVLDANGERTFFSYRGANASPYGMLPPDLLGPRDYLHLSGYSFQDEHSRHTSLALMEQARACGATTSLDASFHFARQRPLEALADLDFIFPNLDEARLLGGTDDLAEAAARIRELGPKTVIVTLGEQGCYIESDQVTMLVPAYPAAKVVDSTGAGDAFCGGFLAGTIWGLNVEQAARVGHLAAVGVIAQMGGHQAAPSLDDVLKSELLPEALRMRIASVHKRGRLS